MKLPHEIFITVEDSGDSDRFLLPHTSANTVAVVGERRKAGRYVLQEIVFVDAVVKLNRV